MSRLIKIFTVCLVDYLLYSNHYNMTQTRSLSEFTRCAKLPGFTLATGDLKSITDSGSWSINCKGPKYRFPSPVHLTKRREEIANALQDCARESMLNLIKYGRKDQELIQSSTTSDPGYQWESDKHTADTTNESQEVSPFPAGDHKAHINRCTQKHSKHKTEQKHKRST